MAQRALSSYKIDVSIRGVASSAPRPYTHTPACQGSRNHGTLEEAERAHILATVKETKWVLSGPRGAATRLGMNRSTLQFRMKKLGIARPWTCECQP